MGTCHTTLSSDDALAFIGLNVFVRWTRASENQITLHIDAPEVILHCVVPVGAIAGLKDNAVKIPPTTGPKPGPAC